MSDSAPLPDLLTPCSPPELYTALRTAWATVCAPDPVTRPSLLVLMAQWAIETGWGHYCHRWNIGNYKHVPGDGRQWTMFPCGETVDGKNVMHYPPDPTCAFLAYDTLDEGAADYLGHLRGRFARAWPAVLAGDIGQFCHLLKIENYYTASEAQYTSTATWCFHHLDSVITPDAAPTVPEVA
jgi:hypothetical protein